MYCKYSPGFDCSWHDVTLTDISVLTAFRNKSLAQRHKEIWNKPF